MAVEVGPVGERVHQVGLHVPGPEALRVRLQKRQGGRDGAPVLCLQVLDCSLIGGEERFEIRHHGRWRDRTPPLQLSRRPADPLVWQPRLVHDSRPATRLRAPRCAEP